MDHDTARYVIDLEGRLTALSGIVSVLICALRERGLMSHDLERQIFESASSAAATLPPGMDIAADRLILALSNAQPAAAGVGLSS